VPHDEIVAYAEEVDASLLVMGYRGHTHEEKMGSVVDRVLHETSRQVLAV
jgi:nucleotide-binding universal stress UspA family protein